MSTEQNRHEHWAALFSLLSHGERLRILDELRHADACVCHLQHWLGRPQVYVSQQLRVLREAGVVDSYRDGVNIFYQLVDAQVAALLDLALGPVPAERARDPNCPCPRCSSGNCGAQTTNGGVS